MATRKVAGKDVVVEKRGDKQRALSVFPTAIGSLSKEDRAKLAFKPDGMAATIIQALEKHGAQAGEKRKLVVEQVKAKFKDASDSTIRTQVYRGIVHLRTTQHQ